MNFSNTVLGVSRKTARPTRGVRAKRTPGSATQARARLQAQFGGEAPSGGASVAEPMKAESVVTDTMQTQRVSIATFLKTPAVSSRGATDSAPQGLRNAQSMAESNAVAEAIPATPEQIRCMCIDHAVLLSKLKRIDTAALATMLGMPTDNVRKALTGVEEALRAPEWDRLIEIMGIDPQTARMSRAMPHFIHVTPATRQSFQALEGAFINMRAARMQFDDTLVDRIRNKAPRIAVMQNDHLRIVVIEHEGVRALDSINQFEWARGSEKASQVKSVFKRERFVAGDLTAIEFDTIFAGDRRIDWQYVELVARANRVSMEDIVGYIQSVGEEKSKDAQTYLKVVNGN